MVELVDSTDLGDVTLVKGFCAVPRRGHSSVKAGSPVFITADQALRSASASSPCKKQRTTKKRQNALSLIYAGMVEMVDSEDLGDVTLVKGFCAILAVDILR